MKKILSTLAIFGTILLAACSHQNPTLDISLSEKFEGQKVEVMNFLDSTSLATAVVTDGKAQIVRPDSTPVFASVLIDGRTRAFYVVEPGVALVNDSTNSAIGTPLNNKFSGLLAQLDSIENLDDMGLYMDFVEKSYNENKNNPIGSYFGIEWIKYAPLNQVDSLLAIAPESLKKSPKAQHYRNFAALRAITAPGQPFIDFEGETLDGKSTTFASFVKPGKYTLVDFWASWCPYCIKELPDMASLYQRWKDNGLEIVGVAVRDTPDDSKAAVSKHNITWPVIYNTQRKPYDIYGFSGIPHHMLIGPDGKIVSRDESLSQIEARLKAAAKEAQTNK
ncbi:MAG: TlpA family protein disulfide reductase [Bacteroides sp.]|nr:TlpA family protein disulfide reductase [Bacteroides sp.]